MDRLCSLKSRLGIPLAHVPGVLVAGSFHLQADRVFWDVRDAAKAVVIRLTDERYARLVIGVDDPAQTVASIRTALASTNSR
jgi:hypothetical protein